MDSWRCSICGYDYKPKKGDPGGGIPPHTPFEALPPDWNCPVCGAPQDKFFPVKWVE